MISSVEDHLFAYSEKQEWFGLNGLVHSFRDTFQRLNQEIEKANAYQDFSKLNHLMEDIFKAKNELQSHPEYIRFLVYKEDISLLQKSLENSEAISASHHFVSRVVAETIQRKENLFKELVDQKLKEQKESLTQELGNEHS